MTTPPAPPLQRLHKKSPFIIPDWRLFFKTRWKVIGLCLIGVLLLEIFIFNLPTWQTLRAIPSTQNISSIHTDGIEIKPDGLTTTIQNANLNVTSKKIIKYLSLQSARYGSKEFAVEYSREELASYLDINRSVLSHELKSMERDGIIKVHKNNFILL